ncbi:MAG: hypothetical protein KAH01_07435 [Caldisericia bacterium]|nr:hypothetical protein [Caldisericia bacterium]
MKSNCRIINGSKLVAFFVFINSSWENSYINKYSSLVSKYVSYALQTSFIVQWFTTKSTIFSKNISESFICNEIVNILFRVVRIFTSTVERLTKNSYSEDLSKSVKNDLNENGISVVSSILFSFLVVYLLLELFFGNGFSRQVALTMFLVCVCLFVFSFFLIPPKRVLSESRLWKWIREIFQ